MVKDPFTLPTSKRGSMKYVKKKKRNIGTKSEDVVTILKDTYFKKNDQSFWGCFQAKGLSQMKMIWVLVRHLN